MQKSFELDFSSFLNDSEQRDGNYWKKSCFKLTLGIFFIKDAELSLNPDILNRYLNLSRATMIPWTGQSLNSRNFAYSVISTVLYPVNKIYYL